MIYLGNKMMSEVYFGDTVISEIYKGSDLVFSAGGNPKFTYTGNWTVVDNVFTSNKISDGQVTVETIHFSKAKDLKVRLSYTQDSEKSYDYGIFSKYDMNAVNVSSGSGNVNNQSNAYNKTSGTVEYPVITDNDEHYIQLMYRKDGSVSSGKDNIIVTLEFIK